MPLIIRLRQSSARPSARPFSRPSALSLSLASSSTFPPIISPNLSLFLSDFLHKYAMILFIRSVRFRSNSRLPSDGSSMRSSIPPASLVRSCHSALSGLSFIKVFSYLTRKNGIIRSSLLSNISSRL